MRKIKILICCCFWSFLNAGAQTEYLQSFTSKNGLSQNSVYSILSTPEGFCWFGTQDGLNRFDGKGFKVYYPSKGGPRNQVTSKMVTALCLDNQNLMWVGTVQGISLFNRFTEKFQPVQVHYPNFPVRAPQWITGILQDESGRLFISTNDSAYYIFDTRQGKEIVPADRPKEKLIGFRTNYKNQIFAFSERELYLIENNRFITQHIRNSGLPQANIVDMLPVGSTIWCITGGDQITILDASAGNWGATKFSSRFNSRKVLTDARLLHQSNDHTVWIGTRSQGVLKVNLVTKETLWFEADPLVSGLQSQFILSMHTSIYGQTWIGQSAGGVSQYDAGSLRLKHIYTRAPVGAPKYDNMILSIATTDSKHFYMGTLAGGLLHYNYENGDFAYYSPPSNLLGAIEAKNIYEIVPESPQKLWLATWGGLYSFNTVTKKFTSYSLSGERQTKQLYALLPLKDSVHFLVSSGHGGVLLFNKKTFSWSACKDVDRLLDISGLRVRYMIEKDNGDVFMSTEVLGFVKYNYLTGKFQVFPEFLAVSGTSRYFKFYKNNLWIATDDGLIQADTASMRIKKVWTTADGLSNNYIYALLPDEKGNLWISSNGGLCILNYENVTCIKLQESNGLQGTEFNTACCLKDRNANLWFGGVNGINVVGADQTILPKKSNPPTITQIRVMHQEWISDTSIPFLRTLRLPASKNFIGFNFQTLAISQPEAITYAHQLKGVDTGWVVSHQRNFANYTQLKPGTYWFYLRSANEFGIWSSPSPGFQIVIVPAWYQTNLFKFLALASVIALGFRLIKQRTRTIHERNAVQQKIRETEMAVLRAQMNPHFIFNCINSIDSFIHSNDKYNATTYLNKFARLIRNVLMSSRKNLVLLSKDVETLKLYVELEELRHDYRFTTEYQIDEELLRSDYKVPALIVQPFVENAIVHGLRNKKNGPGLLKVSIARTATEFIVYTIEDNGVGIFSTQRNNQYQSIIDKEESYGIAMSIERIKLFNGGQGPGVEMLEMESDDQVVGTKIIIHLKIT